MSGQHGHGDHDMKRSKDQLHDLQLLRDLQIVNQRTQRELGPLPPGGLPVEPKRKPNIQQDRPPHESASKEEDAMKVPHAAVAAAMIGVAGTLTACTQKNDLQPTTRETPHAQQSHIDSDDEINFPMDRDKNNLTDDRNKLVNSDDFKPDLLNDESRYGMRDSYFACIDASGGATWVVQECISEEWEFQDSRMNTAYQELKQHLPEQKWLQVRDEQRAWLSNFESGQDCAWNSETEGQAQRIVANECALRALATRVAILEKMISMRSLEVET